MCVLRIFSILFFVFLTQVLSAQMYLSVENANRFIRHKAYAGDKVKILIKGDSQKTIGHIDSLSIDGKIRIDRRLISVDSIEKVYRRYTFQKSFSGRKLLGGLLVAGSLLYMGGTVVNGLILNIPISEVTFTRPLLILATGGLLLPDWKRYYRNGKRWEIKIMQI